MTSTGSEGRQPTARPRIGYLTGEYPRATDTWIQREVRGLGEHGVEVHTFAVRRPGQEHAVGPEQAEAAASTTYLLEQARSPVLILTHLRALATSPRNYLGGLKLAWTSRRLGLKGTVFNLIYFVEAVVLADEMRKRGITHLHNHFGDSSCSVAMLASTVSGIPYSFTIHGSAIFFEAHTWRLDEKVRRARFVNTISWFCRSQTAIFTEPDEFDKLHIVHCGVEPHRHRPVDHEGRGHRLLFVGRVVAHKGLSQLFQAMVDLAGSDPDIELTVVGDGPDRAALEAEASALDLAPRVHFVGARSQDEVADHISQSDIFVLPSFAEGLPVVLMEALASGVPVVSTRVAGVQELVIDGLTGLVVHPSDTASLADAIQRLVTDPDLRDRMGKAGRELVLAEFDSSTEAGRLAQLFVDAGRELASPLRPQALTSGS